MTPQEFILQREESRHLHFSRCLTTSRFSHGWERSRSGCPSLVDAHRPQPIHSFCVRHGMVGGWLISNKPPRTQGPVTLEKNVIGPCKGNLELDLGPGAGRCSVQALAKKQGPARSRSLGFETSDEPWGTDKQSPQMFCFENTHAICGNSGGGPGRGARCPPYVCMYICTSFASYQWSGAWNGMIDILAARSVADEASSLVDLELACQFSSIPRDYIRKLTPCNTL